MEMVLRKKNGVTLIELLIALVIFGLLGGSLYKTFVSQTKSYTIEDQLVDMQQNIRAGINRMMREIRMSGFGNVSMVLPVTLNGSTFNNVVNPNTPVAGSLTIISANETGPTLTAPGNAAQNQITLTSLADNDSNVLFDTGNRRYVSIGGLESYTITNITGNTLTLSGGLTYNHPAGTPVFGIRAINYQVGIVGTTPTLLRDENDGAGAQPEADSIETLQFGYFDANGNVTANPPDIRMVQVTLTARTNMTDPDLKGGDGYRRRQIASDIHLKNMGIAL